MADLHKAEAAAREALAKYWDGDEMSGIGAAVDDLLAALDAARGEAIHQVEGRKNCWRDCSAESAEAARKDLRDVRVVYAAPPAALAVPADNVVPMRQPRADLARLVESINSAVYANGNGLSVTEAIGALELAKLELLKEQEQ